jgi:PBP4 family serine-type D-alanyl-D-alanine carboxypeptidase
VYAHNAGASLLPASNEKLALSYAALVVLGPGYRLRTEVVGDGHLRDGVVWDGDLILRGYGDPTLDWAGLLELARRLRAEGIRSVTGSLIADEAFFDARRSGPGWKSYFVVVGRAGSTSAGAAVVRAALAEHQCRSPGLPVGGREGTLRHRHLGAAVRAKTGTLTNASALSG